MENQGAVSTQFERAAHSFRNSALYRRLSQGISKDSELLELASNAKPVESAPRLFLTAVHFMLLNGDEHHLRYFFPTIVESVAQGDPFPYFRSFCLAHAEEIAALISSPPATTQQSMNFRRCAQLVPAFQIVASENTETSLALVEIGSSAGLNLLWDHYAYDYGDGWSYGDSESPVKISCALRGHCKAHLSRQMPKLGFRLGIDLNPISLQDENATLWLFASIPPGNIDAEAFWKTINFAKRFEPRSIRGNALDLLPGVLESVPIEQNLCVLHTHTLEQFSSQSINRLSRILREHSRKRRIYEVSIEHLRGKEGKLELVDWDGGKRRCKVLAYCAHSGEWLEWMCTRARILRALHVYPSTNNN